MRLGLKKNSLSTTPNIAIVILAAGASKRMGTPKQLLPWDSTSLLGHATTTALKFDATEIIVVLGANHQLIEKEISQYSITILYNKNWESGLGNSIAHGVKYIMDSKSKIDGLLIILADQPFISESYLNAMMQNFKKNTNSIIATSYEDGKYGVPVLFDKVYFNELSHLNDDSGAKHVLKKHQEFVKLMTSKVNKIDIDSREDYKQWFNSNNAT